MRIVLGGLLAACALLVGCASPYATNTLFGGYKDEQVGPQAYRVRFDGNGNTGKDQVWSYWIYRCAELTREKGFRYFVPSREVLVTSALPNGQRYRFAQAANGWRKAAYIYIPATTITTWHSDAIVNMFNDVPPDDVREALQAEVILAQLKDYVASGGKTVPPNREQLLEAAKIQVSLAPLLDA